MTQVGYRWVSAAAHLADGPTPPGDRLGWLRPSDILNVDDAGDRLDRRPGRGADRPAAGQADLDFAGAVDVEHQIDAAAALALALHQLLQAVDRHRIAQEDL